MWKQHHCKEMLQEGVKLQFLLQSRKCKNCTIVFSGFTPNLTMRDFSAVFFSWIFFPLKLTCMWIKSSKSGNITEILNMLMHGNSNRVLFLICWLETSNLSQNFKISSQNFPNLKPF